MPGRVLLYLFDHPEGASLEHLERLILVKLEDSSQLHRVLGNMLQAGEIEFKSVELGGQTTGRRHTNMSTRLVAGYRLTTKDWLRMARATQDVEHATGKS